MHAAGCRVYIVALFVLAGTLALAGCGAPREAAPDGIITMAPHLTETVFALGEGDRVIARGKFDDYPPEAAALPDAGGYIDPKLERIALLEPRLIIVPGKHPAVTDYAAQHGIQVLNVHMDSFETITRGFGTIAEALDCAPAGEALRQEFLDGMAAVRAYAEGRPRVRVLVITNRSSHDLDSLYTAGPGSFVAEMIEVAGGENLFADASGSYFEASKETVVLRAPEAILEFHCGENLSADEEAAFVADWDALPTLPAVQNGRIHIITDSHGTRPGPRLPEVARRIATLLHGDVE